MATLPDRDSKDRPLDAHESDYRAIFEAANDAIFVHDIKSGSILDVNQCMCDLYGYTAAEAARLSVGDLSANEPPYTDEYAKRWIHAAAEGEPQLFEWLAKDKSGKTFWVEVNLKRTRLAGTDVLLAVVRDIELRKRVIDQLRQSEDKFAKAFSANPQPMSLSTLPDGRYLDVNESFLSLSGYTRDEVIARTSLELNIWETPEHRADFLKRLSQSQSIKNVETRFRMKNGSFRLLLASAEQLEIGGEKCLLVAASDITDRNQAENSLRESRDRLLLAHEAARMGTFEWNIQTGVNIWSPELEAMYGLPRGSFAGTQPAWEMLVHPDDRESAIGSVQRAMATREPVEAEWRVTWPDGSVHWLFGRFQLFTDAAGEPFRLVGINIDITDRKNAETALRESEQRFRHMADNAPVMIWVSGTDTLCTYFNQQWLDFTGRRMEQELGNGWAEGVHAEDYGRCLESYVSAFNRREPFQIEYRLRKADGEYRWIFDTGTPRFSVHGEFLGYIGSCVDIDERKKVEEDLRLVHEEVSRLKSELEEENIYLKGEIDLHLNFGEVVGQSDALKYVFYKIAQVAPTDTTVLITGETGTGKELVARAIHDASPRRDRPMVKVNCGALSPGLIESEFFGHEKGAFTGAITAKSGRFELAKGGTIFLDEIAELAPELQAKLLRVIQEGEFERLGGSKTIKVNARILAATNRNLEAEVKEGRFRADLWYRLNVFPITVPPLRDRREDIPVLVEHLAGRFAKKMGKTITSVSPKTMKKLSEYSWPGNVRELANVIERATIYTSGEILQLGEEFEVRAINLADGSDQSLEGIEREHITRVLVATTWRIEGARGAASVLGLNPSTLRTRMKRLGIQRPATASIHASQITD